MELRYDYWIIWMRKWVINFGDHYDANYDEDDNDNDDNDNDDNDNDDDNHDDDDDDHDN